MVESAMAESADVCGSCSGNHTVVKRKPGNSSYFNINRTWKCQHEFWSAVLTWRDFLSGDAWFPMVCHWLICIRHQIIPSFQLWRMLGGEWRAPPDSMPKWVWTSRTPHAKLSVKPPRYLQECTETYWIWKGAVSKTTNSRPNVELSWKITSIT